MQEYSSFELAGFSKEQVVALEKHSQQLALYTQSDINYTQQLLINVTKCLIKD